MNKPVQELPVTPLTTEAARFAAAEEQALATLAGHAGWWGGNLPLLQRLGEGLFGLAFGGEATAQVLLQALGGGSVRLAIATDQEAVARLPWEYLCLPPGLAADPEALGWPDGTPPFLALHPRVSLVRRGAGALRPGIVEEIGALRLLIVSANPACAHWPDAALDWDVEAIHGGLRGVPASHIQIEVLSSATRGKLEQHLAAFRPHLLHFTGHGGYPDLDDPGDLTAPSLVLAPEPGDGCHAYLTAGELADLCERHRVRAVVLNSCWGGRGRQSVAGALRDAGLPVVVAMQLPLLVSAAAGLAGALYEGLMVGRPFEECLQDYRRGCVRAQAGAEVPDWGVPVLYLGVDDSALFRPSVPDPYPVNFRPLIRDYVPIVGRGFLFERIHAWCASAPSGIFLLTAAPGLGKTAFAAQWAQDHPGGAHYFFVHREGRSDPDECLRSLYIALLGRHRLLDPEAARLPPVRLRDKLRTLLVETVGPNCAERYLDEVILIDALDESRPATDGIELAELLPRELPPRVYLLLTSRPGPLAERLARRPDSEHLHLEGCAPENLDDAARYTEYRLGERLQGLTTAELGAAARRIAERASGNFLVLRYLLSPQSLGRAATLEAIEAAAARLGEQIEGVYEDFLDRVLARHREDLTASEALDTVLGALATAAAPVTEEQVCAAFRLKASRWLWTLKHLAQFLARGGVREAATGVDTYGLYHETFRDFLIDRYRPDLPGLHANWAAYAQTWPKLQGYARRYALRYLPNHQRQAGQGAALAETLLHYDYLAAALGADGAGPPPRTPFELVADFELARNWVPAEQRETVRLVGGAIALSTQTLLAASEELPAQLVGRLKGIAEPGVRRFLARLSHPRPWLRPLSPTLAAADGPLLRVLIGHTGTISHVALAGDGRAVSAAKDKTLRVWDLASGECRQVLKGHKSWITQLALTEDGRAVSASFLDKTLRVWDLEKGGCRQVLGGHNGWITQLALTWDGQAVSASADNTLRVWDLASGACLRVLAGHTGWVWQVALTGDGRAVSASADNTLRVWDLTSGARAAIAWRGSLATEK